MRLDYNKQAIILQYWSPKEKHCQLLSSIFRMLFVYYPQAPNIEFSLLMRSCTRAPLGVNGKLPDWAGLRDLSTVSPFIGWEPTSCSFWNYILELIGNCTEFSWKLGVLRLVWWCQPFVEAYLWTLPDGVLMSIIGTVTVFKAPGVSGLNFSWISIGCSPILFPNEPE